MSPEMARGQKVGEPSDIYAVGLVMAELLAGRPVVRSESQIDVMMTHADDAPHQLDPVVLDSPFRAAIERALSKDVAPRYGTAAQMRADVAAALHLHEQALRVVERFKDLPADMAPTMVYESSDSVSRRTVDPLASTEEQLARTAILHDHAPDSVTPRMTEPIPTPRAAAAPPEFEARVVAVSAGARPATARQPAPWVAVAIVAGVLMLGLALLLALT